MKHRGTYLLVFVVSGAGFLTQTLISGFWTSAFSDDILNYSLHVAVFFLSLGSGAIVVDSVEAPSRQTLFRLGLVVSAYLALVIPLLKCLIVWFGDKIATPLSLLAVQGALVGSFVPLILSGQKRGGNLSLGKVFLVDYFSALVVSCGFTFLLLIPFGYSKTGLFAGGVGCCVIYAVWCLEERRIRREVWVMVPVMVGIFTLAQRSNALVSVRKEKDRSSKVILSRQSHYQKIVLMEETPLEPGLQNDRQYVLYLDGFLQFASTDEQTYHACLANVPMMAVFQSGRTPQNALILGGGDGLAARNMLLVPGIRKITLVELDPKMIEIARDHPRLREQNLDSLRNSRVEVVTADAFKWVGRAQMKYDLVVVDFPLPKNLTLSRLYAAEFYRQVFNAMTPEGVMAIQAGPSYSFEDPSFETLSKVTASVLKTIEGLGKRAWPYISVLDNEAFVIAGNDPGFDFEATTRKYDMDQEKGFGRLCAFRKNWKRPKVESNSLNHLPISKYMMEWLRAGNRNFFYYRGTSANFLPE